jgi:outer membrane lipoprotein-sorting protein
MLSGNTYSQDASQILKKTDDVTYAPKDQRASIKIIITDKKGNQQSREAEFIQKGNEMRLFRFTAPASQAGIAFLSLPDNVMYLYLPAYGKERRIASSIKNQNFAGTDFSYDDMESKPMSDKFNPKLLEDNPDTYVLELTPKEPSASDYSKQVITIGKDNYYFRKVDYYDRGGRKVKELLNTKIEKIGNYWTATDMLMTDMAKDHKTEMITTDIKFDTNIPDDDFSVRKLKQ